MPKKKIKYDHTKVEPKWRKKWMDENVFTPDLHNAKKPFFNLMMFPYPSAEGLHVGNMYAFSGADMNARFYRMRGFDVFEPIGLDGFGIHSENYAIKVGKHPKDHAAHSEENFYRQMSEIGNSFAWDHRLETYDPDYYKWTQWLFVKLFERGLAYRGTAKVNWCESCKTVLADEQVMTPKEAEKEAKNADGSPVEDPENAQVCERCGTVVERREMSSWYFRITEYADRLLENIDGTGDPAPSQEVCSVTGEYDVKKHGLRWPEQVKTAQRRWIGKKAGINITYKIKDTDHEVTVFTTRPDTNFGATFIVVSPEYAQEHLIGKVPEKEKNNVSKYIKESLNKSEKQRLEEGKVKTGAFTGLYAVNNLNGKELPIYVADFVLSGVGTGAVVGVPGHDKRDFAFAQAFDLPVIRVVVASDGDTSEITKAEQVQEEEGKMMNSDFLDGMDIHEATVKIMDYLEEKGWGERVYNYHLRDWLISRQRYWGPPIPMMYCEACAKAGKGPQKDMPGWFAESVENLPIVLPDIKDFKPKGDGTSPLANAPDDWKFTTCPECGGKASRELDVSDTFMDSSWYHFAYPNLKTEEWKGHETPFNKAITAKWFPVNAYIGGMEHAVLHLLYARFVTMALKDMGEIQIEEPYPFLFGHGLLISEGAKMSKSRGNVVNPDEQIKKFGADTLRAYLRFMGAFDAGGDFRMTGIEGMHRFMLRVWELGLTKGEISLSKKHEEEIVAKMHKTIKKVTSDFEKLKYNTALAAIMELVNLMREKMDAAGKGESSKVWDEALTALVQMLAPYAPHMTEELWCEHMGEKYTIHKSAWPAYDEKLTVESMVTIAVQVNGTLRGQIEVSADAVDDEKAVLTQARELEKVKERLSDGVKKEIYVKGKIVNFVV